MQSEKYIEIVRDKYQTTISKNIHISGIEFLEGNTVDLNLHPAGENTGIKFIINETEIPATIANEKETDLHITALEQEKEKVFVTEHILSALYGLEIDNVIIRVSGGNTIPICDGSAKVFVDKIIQSGITKQKDKKCYIKIVSPFILYHDDSFALFTPNDEGLKIKSIIDFPNTPVHVQEFDSSVNRTTYINEIAPARTFFHKPYTQERWQKIREMYNGLPTNIKDSPVIAWNDAFIHKLRFQNEPTRHKVLDFLGDIALANRYLKANVTLYKPSHKFNRIIARHLQSLEKEAIHNPDSK